MRVTAVERLGRLMSAGAVLMAMAIGAQDVAGAQDAKDAAGAHASDLPSRLACVFQDGGAWSFEKGTFAPKIVEKFAFVVRDIDRTSMVARLERKDGLAVLRMVQAVDALHFIEVGVEGYLNLTTVYEKQASGDHPAVHSRHVAVLGEPLVSQYRGTCTAQ